MGQPGTPRTGNASRSKTSDHGTSQAQQQQELDRPLHMSAQIRPTGYEIPQVSEPPVLQVTISVTRQVAKPGVRGVVGVRGVPPLRRLHEWSAGGSNPEPPD